MLWFERSSIVSMPPSLCECRSMKPGVTIFPVASTVRVAVTAPSRPIAAMRPSFTATSA